MKKAVVSEKRSAMLLMVPVSLFRIHKKHITSLENITMENLGWQKAIKKEK